MLKELHDVTRRIERLSKAEHDMISDVHLTVQEIKESMKDVSDAVTAQEYSEARAPASPTLFLGGERKMRPPRKKKR